MPTKGAVDDIGAPPEEVGDATAASEVLIPPGEESAGVRVEGVFVVLTPYIVGVSDGLVRTAERVPYSD